MIFTFDYNIEVKFVPDKLCFDENKKEMRKINYLEIIIILVSIINFFSFIN